MIDRATQGNSAAKAGYASAEPEGRLGKPEEIAAAVLYLASPLAAFTTGTELVVDGGFEARLLRVLALVLRLYDLGADLGERTDLAAEHPEVAKRLQAAWDEWNAGLKPPALDKDDAKRDKK